MTSRPERLRVLIIEDEPRYRNLLDREIAAMGHATTAFERAEDALSVLETESFDAAVVDLNLPGMSGMEFFEQIRERQPGIAVIINTAYGDMPTAIQALRLEAVDFLTKPCGMNEIERALFKAAQFLERYRAESPETPVSRKSEPSETRDKQPTALSAGPDAPEGLLADVERDHILAVLRRHEGHKPTAAQELGISLRTLYNKLALYRQQGVKLPGDEEST